MDTSIRHGGFPVRQSLAETYADVALGAQQYRPPALVTQVAVTGPKCPTCGERVHQYECTEYRRESGQLLGWLVRVQKCSSTRRQAGSRDLRCGWKEKTVLSPVPVTTEVAQVFEGPQEEPVMTLSSEIQQNGHAPADRLCPECGGPKTSASDKCRKCFLKARRQAGHAAPRPAPPPVDTSLFEQAFSIIMSRPGYVILPLLMDLSPEERHQVEQAALQLCRQSSSR